MKVRYRKKKVCILAAGIWLATAGIWLMAPSYIPFRIADIGGTGFAVRSWPIAAISGIFLSLIILRHVVRIFINGGYAVVDVKSVEVRSNLALISVEEKMGRRRNFSPFIAEVIT